MIHRFAAPRQVAKMRGLRKTSTHNVFALKQARFAFDLPDILLVRSFCNILARCTYVGKHVFKHESTLAFRILFLERPRLGQGQNTLNIIVAAVRFSETEKLKATMNRPGLEMRLGGSAGGAGNAV